MNEEIWKDIPDHPNYQASIIGMIRSIDRIVKGRKDRLAKRKGVILKPGICRGYKIVKLGGKSKTRPVHRLIAITFIPNPENKPTVNHKNGDKSDNRVENLEWATFKQNTLHGRRVLGKCILEKHNHAKLTFEDVNDMKILRSFGASYPSLGKAFGVSHVAARNAVNGITWINRIYNE